MACPRLLPRLLPIALPDCSDCSLPFRHYLQELTKLAQENPETDAEVAALIWCCQTAYIRWYEFGVDAKTIQKTAGDRLFQRYLDRPELAQCVDALAASQANPIEAFQTLANKNPSREVQALAIMAQIEAYRRALELDDQLLDDIAMGGTGRYSGRQSRGQTDETGELIFQDYSRKVYSPEKRQEIVDRQLSWLNEMMGRFGDVPHWRDGNMQHRAARLKHELENLQVGCIAPPLVWTGPNGRQFDLASVRGKVVVIYFWGSWCGPCKQHIPELNRMFKTMADSVTIIGVMSEENREDGEQAVAVYQIEWPNIIENKQGPLTEQWNIDSWPSIVILDHEGRIRFRKFSKNPNAEEIRRRVDRLLQLH